MNLCIRKEAVVVDEVRREIGRELSVPLKKCAAIVIVENPYAKQTVEDLSELAACGQIFGKLLAENVLQALQIAPDAVQSYGKAAVVGLNGEQEHGAALLHVSFDQAVRKTLGDTLSIVPSSEKTGPAGCSVDVPLHSKRAVKVRTHYDAMEVSLADSPRPDEIMLIFCVTTASRPFPRVGGLLLEQIEGMDGVN